MQRYFSNKLSNDIFDLNNDDYYHIVKVMRMKTNDKIEVVYNNNLYICPIEVVNGGVRVIKGKKENTILKNNQEIVLAIPLLKEAKMDMILQKATELGVDKIIPIEMQRSVIKLEKEKEDKKIERWNRICKEASEQSKRIDIPVVTNVKKIKDLNDETGVKIVCSTNEKSKTIKKFLHSQSSYDRIIIVAGPEGGLTNTEEEYLKQMGFNSVTFGSRILRVETVPLFVLSILNYEYME